MGVRITVAAHTKSSRVEAAQAAVAKYSGKPLVWGGSDCVRMAAFVARRLGHKPRLARFGQYTTEAAAKAALARRGYSDVGDAIDDMGFERIPAASALVADILAFPPTEPGGITALAAYLGNGRVLGLHEGSGVFAVLQPRLSIETGLSAWAWRL